MCPDLLCSLIDDMMNDALDGYVLQRNFRNSFVEIVRQGNPKCIQLLDTPPYKFLFSPKEDIDENFIEIIALHLSITGKSLATISEEEKITTSNGILDFFPVFKEKIENNNMNNMLNDGLHVYVASKCSYFICGDNKLVEKAKFLYRVFEIETKVYSVNQFIENVTLA